MHGHMPALPLAPQQYDLLCRACCLHGLAPGVMAEAC